VFASEFKDRAPRRVPGSRLKQCPKGLNFPLSFSCAILWSTVGEEPSATDVGIFNVMVERSGIVARGIVATARGVGVVAGTVVVPFGRLLAITIINDMHSVFSMYIACDVYVHDMRKLYSAYSMCGVCGIYGAHGVRSVRSVCGVCGICGVCSVRSVCSMDSLCGAHSVCAACGVGGVCGTCNVCGVLVVCGTCDMRCM